MNITELRDRLTQIIQENENHGWGERNTSEITAQIKISKRITEYRTIKYASSSWVGLGNTNVFELATDDTPIWRNGNQKRS
jgi:hypothetical protein